MAVGGRRQIVAIGNAKVKEGLIDAAVRELVRSEFCSHRAGEDAHSFPRCDDRGDCSSGHRTAPKLKPGRKRQQPWCGGWRLGAIGAVLRDDMPMMMVVMMVPSASDG